MSKAFDKDGNEIDVYTLDEFQAGVAAETTKIKGEYDPKVKGLETELSEAKTALTARAGEFAQFRKLSDEAVAKLDVAQRTIYENGLALQEEKEKNKKADDERVAGLVDSAIKAKAGGDEKLAVKMKNLWDIIGIDARTPEDIENKTKMVVGAIGSTEPDLVAKVAGFSIGSFAPPGEKNEEEKNFADTAQGQRGMEEIGLKIPKKEEKK